MIKYLALQKLLIHMPPTLQKIFIFKKGDLLMSYGGYYGGFGWRQLLIFLLVIATIFVFVGGAGFGK